MDINASGQLPAAPVTQPTTPPAAKEEKPAVEPKDSFKPTPKAKAQSLSGPWKAASGFSKSLFAGFGTGSGAVGGFAIGGAIGATGNILNGLFTHSLTMTAATGAGLTGGIVGAVIFGACGMIGGYQFGSVLVKGIHKAVDFVKSKM